ncbi:MAG: hypothetical protein VB096_02855 [Pseudoflavonifractor sp.]|nr:hypothetical protein [Pseudoflavonifractor sp.]
MKMILFKRKRVTTLVCLLVAAAMFFAVNHPMAAGVTATSRQLPIYCVQRDQKMISISFDAAWGNDSLRQFNFSGAPVWPASRCKEVSR